jgi:probable blue pigment (indigoidine) exporter
VLVEPTPVAAREAGFFGLTAIAWGGNYLFVRLGLLDATPLWLAALRAGTGVAGVAVYLALARPSEALRGKDRRDALLLGIPNTALFLGLWFVAAGSVPAGTAAVLIYTFPLQVALLSIPLLGRRLSSLHLGAVALGFVGVALLSEPWVEGAAGTPPAALLELLGSAFFWAISTVLFQRRFRSEQMPSVNGYQLLSGAAVLGIGSLLLQPTSLPRSTPDLWVSVAWLGLFGTAFAYAVWFFLLGRVPAPTLAAYSFLVPLVALAISALFVGERLDALQAIGVAFVLGSIYLVARRRETPVGPTGKRVTGTFPDPAAGRSDEGYGR